MCEHRLYGDPTALQCTRLDPHDPGLRGGHVYVSGSYVNDRHPEGGHG
jgi:hypothetical protein